MLPIVVEPLSDFVLHFFRNMHGVDITQSFVHCFSVLSLGSICCLEDVSDLKIQVVSVTAKILLEKSFRSKD